LDQPDLPSEKKTGFPRIVIFNGWNREHKAYLKCSMDGTIIKKILCTVIVNVVSVQIFDGNFGSVSVNILIDHQCKVVLKILRSPMS